MKRYFFEQDRAEVEEHKCCVHTNTISLLYLLTWVDPGLPRRLRATSLLWKGKTQTAINLLQDDVLVADPGTK